MTLGTLRTLVKALIPAKPKRHISVLATNIPKKLPELGKAMGSTLREFKNATKGLADDEDDTKKKELDK